MSLERPFIIVNVDDNDMNLLLIETYLNTIDALFVNFTDATEALEYIRNHKCDMLIVDYHMPKLDGIALTREIKTIDSEIPVIMVTAKGEDAVQINALKAGVNDFIVKPINKTILLNRVQNFIKLRQAIIRLTYHENILQEQIHKATLELQKNIIDLKIAQEITHLGSWTWDIMNGTQEWSDETYRIFGLNPQSMPITYDSFMEFVHPNDRGHLQKAIDAAVYNKAFYNVRHRIIVSDRIKHIHQRGNIYYNDADEPVYMVGTAYDITEVTQAYETLEKKEHETLRVLSRTAEYKDEETANHVKRVSGYAVLIAKRLQMSEQEQEILRFAAPLHDIGKVGTPDHILLKPGSLEEEEILIMREHVLIGANILEDAESLYLQAGHIIALSHHEKFDGSGYPRGLKGEEIPLYGRIVAIADVFDALTSRRPYKQAWSFEDAIDLMKRNAGTHFDPQLINLFTEHLDEVHTIYTQYED